MQGSRLADFVSRSGTRKETLKALAGGPKTPTDLATQQSEHLPHISRALAELRGQGLVSKARSDSGRSHTYKATKTGLELAIEMGLFKRAV